MERFWDVTLVRILPNPFFLFKSIFVVAEGCGSLFLKGILSAARTRSAFQGLALKGGGKGGARVGKGVKPLIFFLIYSNASQRAIFVRKEYLTPLLEYL